MSDLKAIQARSLEMAEYFVAFCKEHDLLCYLCGGGAIGALRNKGFIPWDDDLDFFMPRKDYEKLAELWPRYADERYFLSKSNKDFVDRNLFITIRDKETTCIKPYQQDLDLPHGLALDVLPLDYYPKNPAERKKQVRWALIYSLFCAQTIPEKHGALMKWGSRILLGMTPKSLRYRIWKKAEKEMTKYSLDESDGITELCSGPGYMRNKYPIASFEDYMTPPPADKQLPHHDAVIADMDKSYREYKGEYGA